MSRTIGMAPGSAFMFHSPIPIPAKQVLPPRWMVAPYLWPNLDHAESAPLAVAGDPGGLAGDSHPAVAAALENVGETSGAAAILAVH